MLPATGPRAQFPAEQMGNQQTLFRESEVERQQANQLDCSWLKNCCEVLAGCCRAPSQQEPAPVPARNVAPIHNSQLKVYIVDGAVLHSHKEQEIRI